MTEKDWYIIDNAEELDSPALVVYPARVKQNIALLKTRIDDVERLRPHAKTYKCKEVTQLLIEAGISKFKCATIAEAEMLAMSGAKDILLAYQLVGEKINRFGQLMFDYPDTKFACLVDSLDAATVISDVALYNESEITVYIDLNVGQNRTGIAPDERAFQLYMDCDILPGVNPVGLHAYDGHLHDADFKIRTQKCNDSFAPVLKLQYDLIEKGFDPVIVAGGSPTFPIHAKRKGIECSPGTFVYWDAGYENELTEQLFLTAALVVGRVMSLPDETKICIDVGHKSVSAENELAKRIYFLNAPELKMISQSEEHLVAEAVAGHEYQIGDILYGLPYHICPTVALYERAITIEDNKTHGEWLNLARDRRITI
jgi:D-threonine aldolase